MSDLTRGRFLFKILCLLVLVLGSSAKARSQIITNTPANFIAGTTSPHGFGGDLWKFQTNGTGGKAQEFIDADAVQVIAKACSLSVEDLATVRVVATPDSQWLEFYQISKPDKVYSLLLPPLAIYAKGRSEGHTKEFLLARITNRAPVSMIFDSNLLALSMTRPELRVDLMKKIDSGIYTNRAGQIVRESTSYAILNGKEQTKKTVEIPKHDEVCQWASYFLVDGEIAWLYRIRFKENGSLDNVSDERCDAKEFDPKYENLMKDIDKQITVEMKRNGTSGRLGSIHTFWQLKEEKLKAKGIDWHSPRELNPNANYD